MGVWIGRGKATNYSNTNQGMLALRFNECVKYFAERSEAEIFLNGIANKILRIVGFLPQPMSTKF